jgi:hypothetical protein
LSFFLFVHFVACVCPLSFLYIVLPVLVLCLSCPFGCLCKNRQRTNTGHTIDKKDKGQTPAIQWTKKKNDKHRPYNGQKIQRTNTGNKMDKKDKGQAQAIQCTKMKNDKHRPYNGQKRQRTNTGRCLSFVFFVYVWPVFVICLFCPLYRLCLSFVFFVHCVACVYPLSFLYIALPVLVNKDKGKA